MRSINTILEESKEEVQSKDSSKYSSLIKLCHVRNETHTVSFVKMLR